MRVPRVDFCMVGQRAFTAGLIMVSAIRVFAIALLDMGIGGAGEGLWRVAQTTPIQRAIGLLASGFVTSVTGSRGAFIVAGAAAARAALTVVIALGNRATPVTPSRFLLRQPGASAREREPSGRPFPGTSRSAPFSPTSRTEALFTV